MAVLLHALAALTLWWLAQETKAPAEPALEVYFEPPPKPAEPPPEPEQKPEPKPQPFKRSGDKTARNEPCPCGSGKKYKHCHGKIA